MNTRPEKLPGPDHPITIQHHAQRVLVRVAGHVVADTKSALKLQEAAYPAVFYIPRRDVDMSKLQLTEHTTYCPYKGDCTYYSIPSGGTKSINAVWSYEKPYSSVSKIDHHLAFYPSRVDSIEEAGNAARHGPHLT
ncbi:MAG: DUF427 domain-containing protein [Pseudomonadota bacterium]|nr:DUF427 domain-containing protein [Pseudomonadota bacterium]